MWQQQAANLLLQSVLAATRQDHCYVSCKQVPRVAQDADWAAAAAAGGMMTNLTGNGDKVFLRMNWGGNYAGAHAQTSPQQPQQHTYWYVVHALYDQGCLGQSSL